MKIYKINGNWEIDTVARAVKTALLVFTKRLSRYEIIIKLKDKTQKGTISALDKLAKEYKDKFRLLFNSITLDNGIDILDMAGLEKSVYDNLYNQTTIYYAYPCCSWEKAIRKTIIS